MTSIQRGPGDHSIPGKGGGDRGSRDGVLDLAVRAARLRRGQQVVATCWLHQPTEKVVPKNSRGTIIRAPLFGPVVVAFDVDSRRHGRRGLEVRVDRRLLQRTR